MDEGKILIVNVSKGLIGEDNASILGSFLVTKIQLAAMSRSDITEITDRRPFYLYVDEFQNFATDSFATILSEARKYGLNLTVANQYISQMDPAVRDAVFGNVGTMISFRVSADDSPILAKQFEPQFEANDLLQMHNRNFIINMVINGEKAPAFSATTLNLPETLDNYTRDIIEHSRREYGQSRQKVEAMIDERIRPGSTGVSVDLAGGASQKTDDTAATQSNVSGTQTKRRRRRRRKSSTSTSAPLITATDAVSGSTTKTKTSPTQPTKATEKNIPMAPHTGNDADDTILSIHHTKQSPTESHHLSDKAPLASKAAKKPVSPGRTKDNDDPTFLALR